MPALTALVTDVKYRMSLALIRDLAEAGVKVAACQVSASGGLPPLGFYSKFTSETHLLPADAYEDALYSLCEAIFRREGFRPVLLPVGAATQSLLSQKRVKERFSAVCGLCVPEEETLNLLNDKARAAQLADSAGIPVPRSFSPEAGETLSAFASRVNYPCVVKPLCGERLGLSAEQRYAVVRTPETLAIQYEHFSRLAGEPPLVQEYLPGGGLGCSVLAQDGEIVSLICHRRLRELPVTGGPSTCCETISSPLLEDYAARLITACRYTGPAMVEFREDAEGSPRFLEVNPRIWGTYPLTRAAKSGFSLALFTLAWNAGNPEHPLPLPARSGTQKVRMRYFPSDLAAARGYLKRGEFARARAVARDLFRPAVRDGLWEWRDPRPGLVYLRSLLKRIR